MKASRILALAILLLLSVQLPAQISDLDQQLTELAGKLSAQIQEQKKTKVAVLDFTDLQGNATEFGRYVAEELTVNLVTSKRGFSVLDRANLQRILAEHKLTATGLVDPENAKKLGQFSGVDALILGNLVTLNQNVQLTAKIITTDTAEIVGAAKGLIKSDETVQSLLSKPTEARGAANAVDASAGLPIFSKNFDDLRVELKSVNVVGQQQIKEGIKVSNQNPKSSVWVALAKEESNTLKGGITDAAGKKWTPNSWNLASLATTFFDSTYATFYDATEIAAKESVFLTIPCELPYREAATPKGVCELELVFLTRNGPDSRLNKGKANAFNVNLEIK